jgi:hypothetical protein
MALDKKISESILLNETYWKMLRQVHQLLEPFKESQELLKGDEYFTLYILQIVTKFIRTALKEMVDAEVDGEAQKRIKNLAKKVAF